MSIDTPYRDQPGETAQVLSPKSTEGFSGTIRWGWVVLGAVLAALFATTFTFELVVMADMEINPGPFLLNLVWPSCVLGVLLAALLLSVKVKHRPFKHGVISAILSIPLSLALTYVYYTIYIVIRISTGLKNVYIGPR